MGKVLLLICILFPVAGPLAAQSDAEAGLPKKPGRSAWFACTSIPQGLENPVKVMGGDQITELELPAYMASAPVKIPADGILRIVKPVPDPEKPGKSKYLVLAEAKIPEATREALVILGPLPKPDGSRIFQSSVQDLSSFKGGDRFFINLSDTNVSVQIGETTVTVPAKRAEMYHAPSVTKPTNAPIIYRFYHPEEKRWKLLSGSTVVLRPSRREICVFNNGSRLGTIEKHKILFPLPVETPKLDPE